MKQEMMWWEWHQLDHIQIICISLQTDNHASTSSLKLFTGRMLFLMLEKQHKSIEGILITIQERLLFVLVLM